MKLNNPLIQGKYKKITKIGEGSGGKVYLVEQITTTQINNQNGGHPNIQTVAGSLKPTRQYHALKKLKQYGKNSQNITHQIDLLSTIHHPNIIKFDQVFSIDKVMEYCIDVLDFFKFKQVSLTDVMIKQILWQLVNAIEFLHNKNIIHRDIKPSNMLITSNGTMKLADFDIATPIKQEMTKNMVTRYYRPPQMMFGAQNYSFQVDIWSLGCTIAQMILQQPLFPGTTDIDQLQKIFTVLGTPSKTWPQAQNYPFYLDFVVESQKGLQNILPIQNKDLLDLIKQILVLNPSKRINIKDIKQHPYFQNINTDYSELSKVSSYIINKKITSLTK